MLRGRGWRVKFNKLVSYYFQLLRYHAMRALYPAPAQLNRFERRVYSQNGEDGLIQYIFSKVGTTNKYFVEIGAGDGTENNTRFLKSRGWRGLQIDALTAAGIKNHFVTAENIETLLKRYKTPKAFDLLSIDIDGIDYWLWRAISRYQPRVVIIEYNASIKPQKTLAVPYDPRFTWDGTTFFGASLGAMNKLAHQKGYRLVATNRTGVNAFFIQEHLADKFLSASAPVTTLYHPPKYRLQADGSYGGHPKSSKMSQMVPV